MLFARTRSAQYHHCHQTSLSPPCPHPRTSRLPTVMFSKHAMSDFQSPCFLNVFPFENLARSGISMRAVTSSMPREMHHFWRLKRTTKHGLRGFATGVLHCEVRKSLPKCEYPSRYPPTSPKNNLKPAKSSGSSYHCC